MDDNGNEFSEPDYALFLSTDTPTQSLGLQGSTLLEPRPLPSEDIRNANQIELTFKAIQQLAESINKIVSSSECSRSQSATSVANSRQKRSRLSMARNQTGIGRMENRGESKILLARPMMKKRIILKRKLAKRNVVFSHPPKGIYESDPMFGSSVPKIKKC